MSYFECSVCGMYKDDGDYCNKICAMCILRSRNLKRGSIYV